MTFANDVSQALSGIDHSNNAGNKYDLLVDVFAAELRVGSSEVIAKSIGAQAGNALPRLGEAANSTSTGFVLGVCNFGTED